ncbi:MAG: hypothetical protein HZR80_21120 [Candidatus Heimdallarchaeota archaeon]
MKSREYLLKRKYVDLYQIASNPDNPKEIALTDEQIQSYKEFGIKDPMTIRPISKEDFDLDPKIWQYVTVDGDHRRQFQIENPPEDTMLTVGKHVIIEDLTRLEAYDLTVQMNETRYTYGPKEYCKIIERYRSIDKKISGREITRRTGIPRSTISRYNIFLKEASKKEKDAVFSGDFSIKQWEVSRVGHSEKTSSPKPEIQLFLTEDQYHEFSLDFDELDFAEKEQPNGDRIIIFDNPSEYGKFTTAAQAFVTKDDLKFIEKEFTNDNYTIVSQFKDSDMVGIFWLDLDAKKEFEESKIDRDSKVYILNREEYNYLFCNYEDDFNKLEEKSSGDSTLVKVIWTNTEAEKVYQEYFSKLAEEIKQKVAAATLEAAESQEIDLENFNKEILITTDLDIIKKVWGYDVYESDYNTSVPEGYNAIVWTDLKKMAEYKQWTEEDRRNLIKEHFKDKLTYTIPTEVFDQYTKDKGWTGIIDHEKDEAIPHVHVLFRSMLYLGNFEHWLIENSSKSDFVVAVDWYSLNDDIKESFDGKMLSLDPKVINYRYSERLLLFYTKEARKAFSEAIDDEKKPGEFVTEAELATIQKHLPSLKSSYKVKEYKDADFVKNRRLLCEDLPAVEAIRDFLRPSRSRSYHRLFDFSVVPETEWIEHKANAVPIPLKIYKKYFEPNIYSWLDKTIELITSIKKNKKASLNELFRLSEYAKNIHPYEFKNAIEQESKLWRAANGTIEFLIICSNCLQEKYLPSKEVKDRAKAVCHSCQAGVLYGDLLESRKEKQPKETTAVEEEAA